jgi:hypothetical protein
VRKSRVDVAAKGVVTSQLIGGGLGGLTWARGGTPKAVFDLVLDADYLVGLA